MSDRSLLETVADHEKGLAESLSSAEEEARALSDAAHDEAASTLSHANAELDREIAALRKEAAEARDSEQARIEQESAARVDDIRRNAESKLQSALEEILRRILP